MENILPPVIFFFNNLAVISFQKLFMLHILLKMASFFIYWIVTEPVSKLYLTICFLRTLLVVFVLVCVLQGSAAKMGLEVQEVYWGNIWER